MDDWSLSDFFFHAGLAYGLSSNEKVRPELEKIINQEVLKEYEAVMQRLHLASMSKPEKEVEN